MNLDKIIKVALIFIGSVVADGLVIIPMGVNPDWHVPSGAFWITLIGFNGAMVGLAAYFIKH